MKDITCMIKTSTKTIMRDLQELQQAGLLQIKFSKKENGYVHVNDDCRCPFAEPEYGANKSKNIHFEKLRRLATIMIRLRNHIEYPFYDEQSKNQETCVTWYKKQFPTISKRTMQRDFKLLNEIGYEINYSYDEKMYTVDFPEGLEGIEVRLQLKTGIVDD